MTDTLDQGLNGTNATDNGLGSMQEFQYEGGYGYSDRGGSGLMQVGARVYDPAQGRFMQQDPLSQGQGDWSYAGGSPANAVDPTGLLVGVDDFVEVCVGFGALYDVGQGVSDIYHHKNSGIVQYVRDFGLGCVTGISSLGFGDLAGQIAAASGASESAAASVTTWAGRLFRSVWGSVWTLYHWR